MRPSYKTGEYWLSVAAVLLGALMASGLIADDTPWGKLFGVMASVLGALGYTVSRHAFKGTAMKVEALSKNPPQP